MKQYKVKVNFPILHIVADGGISTKYLGEGRLIPAIIVNTENYKEILELIKVHAEIKSTDTKVVWSKRPSLFKKLKDIFLIVEFEKPMVLKFGICFILKKHYSLIDGIIQSRGLYLQSGILGDKVSNNVSNNILFTVPDSAFDDQWSKILLDVVKDNLKKKGAPKRELKQISELHINQMRELWHIRPQYK